DPPPGRAGPLRQRIGVVGGPPLQPWVESHLSLCCAWPGSSGLRLVTSAGALHVGSAVFVPGRGGRLGPQRIRTTAEAPEVAPGMGWRRCRARVVVVQVIQSP